MHSFPINPLIKHEVGGSEESTCQCRRPGFDPWVGKIPWRRAWQPTPASSPGESRGQRSPAACGSGAPKSRTRQSEQPSTLEAPLSRPQRRSKPRPHRGERSKRPARAPRTAPSSRSSAHFRGSPPRRPTTGSRWVLAGFTPPSLAAAPQPR